MLVATTGMSLQASHEARRACALRHHGEFSNVAIFFSPRTSSPCPAVAERALLLIGFVTRRSDTPANTSRGRPSLVQGKRSAGGDDVISSCKMAKQFRRLKQKEEKHFSQPAEITKNFVLQSASSSTNFRTIILLL